MSLEKIKRVLITGVTGSGGSYLAEHVVKKYPQIEVHGIGRWHSAGNHNNLSEIRDKVLYRECDLMDFSSILNALKESKPDVIFHLASHANVRASFDTPLSVISNNVMGTANLFEAIRASNSMPVVQMCSTSEVYGQVMAGEIPITENNALRPTSPYAVSKVAQDLLGYTYFSAYGIPVVRTRMFAYLNPRRVDLFATSFARQVARIEVGLQDELVHGNLDSVRTIVDVRDAMSAYWAAALYCKPGEVYNIGGGTSISVGEFLDLLKSLARTRIPSRIDSALLRPADVTLQIPDISKFQNQTNWYPQYTFQESVEFLLNYWRGRVLSESI